MSKGRQYQCGSGQGRRGCGFKKEDAHREARILQALGEEDKGTHLVQQCIVGDVPDGRLAHFREYCVGELGGERRSDAGSSVCTFMHGTPQSKRNAWKVNEQTFAVMSKPNSISTVDRDF